jgi:hypothetical protein
MGYICANPASYASAMPIGPLWIFVGAPVLIATLLIVCWLAPARVTRARVRALRWLVLAAALRLCVRATPEPLAGPSLARIVAAASIAIAVWFGRSNWRGRTSGARLGLVLIATGACANAVPTLWTGAMPFSPERAIDAGLSAADVADPGVGHVSIGSEPATVSALADVIALPHLQTVASVGDLLLVAGLVALLSCVFPRRRRRPGSPDTDLGSRPRAVALSRGEVRCGS